MSSSAQVREQQQPSDNVDRKQHQTELVKRWDGAAQTSDSWDNLRRVSIILDIDLEAGTDPCA